MPLPDFCLLPHEVGDLAPDEPLCAPADERVSIWKWFKREVYLTRRVKRRGGQMMFVAREESNPQSPLLRFELLSERELASPKLAVKSQRFTRRLPFDAQGNLNASSYDEKPSLLLQHYGSVYWCFRSESKMFYWKNSRPAKTACLRLDKANAGCRDRTPDQRNVG